MTEVTEVTEPVPGAPFPERATCFPSLRSAGRGTELKRFAELRSGVVRAATVREREPGEARFGPADPDPPLDTRRRVPLARDEPGFAWFPLPDGRGSHRAATPKGGVR